MELSTTSVAVCRTRPGNVPQIALVNSRLRPSGSRTWNLRDSFSCWKFEVWGRFAAMNRGTSRRGGRSEWTPAATAAGNLKTVPLSASHTSIPGPQESVYSRCSRMSHCRPTMPHGTPFFGRCIIGARYNRDRTLMLVGRSRSGRPKWRVYF